MKRFSIAFIIGVIIFVGCNGGNKNTAAKPFCSDTACITEPLKFESAAQGKPFVSINFKNCAFDTIHWEKSGGVIRDRSFQDFFGEEVKPSKQFISCEIVGSKNAWIKFNDCATGQGYLLKLAFNKDSIEKKMNSALNNFDPKYKVEEGLVVYYDNTFIYVIDINADKVAQQLLTAKGVTKFNPSDPNTLVDTLNVTKSKLYAKIFDDNGKAVEHNVPLAFK